MIRKEYSNCRNIEGSGVDSEGNTIDSSEFQISERSCPRIVDKDPSTDTFEIVPSDADKREDKASNCAFRTSCKVENAAKGKWLSIIYTSESSIIHTSMNSFGLIESFGHTQFNTEFKDSRLIDAMPKVVWSICTC